MKLLIPLLVVCALCRTTTLFADDEATLNQAIRALNARAKTDADKKLVLTAVSQQTKMPEKTLQSQMGTTHLNYGELLAADSLAQGTGKNVNAVIAMKQGKGWAQLSKELRINPNSIVDRLRAAEKNVQAGAAGKQVGSTKKPDNVNQSTLPSPPPIKGGY